VLRLPEERAELPVQLKQGLPEQRLDRLTWKLEVLVE
jgi:hypothetical protein